MVIDLTLDPPPSIGTTLSNHPVMRKFAAILFTLVGVAAAIDGVLTHLWYDDFRIVEIIADILLALMALATALYLFRPKAHWNAAMECPSCHDRGCLQPMMLTRARPSVMALLFGGIIITLFIQHIPAQQFKCSACSSDTYRRPAASILILSWCVLSIFLFYVLVTLDIEA